MINKKNILLSALATLPIWISKSVSAHCPLCTIGAGAAAGAALWLGINKVVIALFVGAFAMSMGMWFARIVKKQYIPFQKAIITIVIFLATLLPLLPIFKAIGPLYIPFIGEYGTTFTINYSVGSSLLGALVTFVSPNINRKIKEKRNGKRIPFQGIIITFSLLIIIGVIMQLILK